MPPLDMTGKPLSRFECWPTWLFYFPIVLYWLALAVRYRSLTLPTAANPFFPTGGLCDDSKAAILELVRGTPAERWFAPHLAILRTRDIDADCHRILSRLWDEDLPLPIVAKPDLGCRGAGVKLIEDEPDLKAYLAGFPEGQKIVLQRYVPEECEAGVFYVRDPREPKGRVVSLTLKYLPYVTGDGRSSLRELIMADPRASRIARVYLDRHANDLETILPLGQAYRLSFVANHFRGAIFRNGNSYITEALSERFDEIARSLPEFHIGRFDVRFKNIAAFQRGEQFAILEVNGITAEPTEIWDRNAKLGDAYRTMLRQISMLFRYGRDNKRRGFEPKHFLEVAWRFFEQRRLTPLYPVTT